MLKKALGIAITSLVLIIFSGVCFAEKDAQFNPQAQHDPVVVSDNLLKEYIAKNDNRIDSLKTDISGTNQEIRLLTKDTENLKTLFEDEKYTLDQGEKNLGLFFQVVSIFLAILALGLGLAAFAGYRGIKELQQETKEWQKKLREQSQELIKQVMDSSYNKTIEELEKKIYKLECFNDVLKVLLAQQKQVPIVPEEQGEDNLRPGEPTNTFDQT